MTARSRRGFVVLTPNHTINPGGREIKKTKNKKQQQQKEIEREGSDREGQGRERTRE